MKQNQTFVLSLKPKKLINCFEAWILIALVSQLRHLICLLVASCKHNKFNFHKLLAWSNLATLQIYLAHLLHHRRPRILWINIMDSLVAMNIISCLAKRQESEKTHHCLCGVTNTKEQLLDVVTAKPLSSNPFKTSFFTLTWKKNVKSISLPRNMTYYNILH